MAEDPYKKSLDEMYGLRRFGIKLGLSTIKRILTGLGNPQNRFSCIHIAGTNGKGSVASALSRILRNTGYNVGLYTSPHLVKFNERITINGNPIEDRAVVDAYEAVKSVHHGEREPTFFEFTTAMALYEFGRQKVDIAVIETGMGGRLDATNVLNPDLCVITNISIEHKSYLGDTIAEIAGEKAGIIKQKIPVITGVKQKDAISTIKNRSKEQKAPLYRMGEDFRVRRNPDGSFSYFGIHHIWKKMKTGLKGSFQVDNAGLILASCEILKKNGTTIPFDAIKKGLEENVWPGRLEAVSASPLVMLDGAHNLMAARNLGRYLKENRNGRSLTMVVGILDDKPYRSILKDLLGSCNKLIITRPKIDRSLPTDILLSAAKDLVSDITVIEDVKAAVRHAIETAKPDDMVCVAGSLYVVGEAKEALER